MKLLRYSLLLLLIPLLIPVTITGCKPGMESQVKDIFTSTAELRQLQPLYDVEYEFISSDELQLQVEETYQEEYPAEEEAIDREIYLLMDLIEEHQDLSEIIVDVQSEQIAGYYDPESGAFYIVSDSAELGIMEKLTIAHEYTHALQDQHFTLLDSLDSGYENNSDAALAALSLAEGDAVLSQLIYALSEYSMAELDTFFDETAELDSDELDAAPAVIRENLLFPYEAGIEFIMQFPGWQYSWESIDEAYSDPPRSTEQIMHPQKYLSAGYRDEPQTVAMPDIEGVLGGTWEMKDSDVLGELNTRIYLEAFLSESAAGDAAAGWGGDSLEYWKDGGGEQLLILYWIWDTDSDAAEFFDAYLARMDEKIDGDWELTLDEATDKRWRTDDQNVYLSKQGANTLVVITTDADIVEGVAAAFD